MSDIGTKLNNEELVHWYPLRIFHSSIRRQKLLKEKLDAEETVVETYIPERLVDVEENTFTSVLANYIFIRISLQNLKKIKADARYSVLRYVMNIRHDEVQNEISKIAYVSDIEMDNFKRVIDNINEQVIILNNSNFAIRPGQRVEITDGVFKGTQGIVKSIKKHLCVVVSVENVISLAITGIHKKFLKKIEN
ncbi:MAG: hypothetical protein IJ213_01035 [Bacteroidales bacterium]|nr:hypothetical protein [Bacteroidales bacterium]